MNIADEMLQTLSLALAGRPPPRVRALHLPPAPWNGSRDGEFGALELDDGSLGLSYVLLDGTLAALVAERRARTSSAPTRWPSPAAGRMASGAERTLGFAAVNALTRHLFDRAGFSPPDATDSIGGLAPQAGEHIGMVGYFPPLVKQVTACGARLTVLELKADLPGPATAFASRSTRANSRAATRCCSTSTVLLNDTLDEVLSHCAGARAFAMIGPGASCLPDPLFRRGVTLLGGVWIEQAEAFKQALATGQPWGRHARKFALARDAYPGIEALLGRVRRNAETRRSPELAPARRPAPQPKPAPRRTPWPQPPTLPTAPPANCCSSTAARQASPVDATQAVLERIDAAEPAPERVLPGRCRRRPAGGTRQRGALAAPRRAHAASSTACRSRSRT